MTVDRSLVDRGACDPNRLPEADRQPPSWVSARMQQWTRLHTLSFKGGIPNSRTLALAYEGRSIDMAIYMHLSPSVAYTYSSLLLT